MAGSPTFFSEGHEPRRADTLWKIEQKILGALNDAGSGPPSGSGFVDQGSGAPASPPSDPTVPWLYTDTDSGTLYYWNVANQAWQ